MKNIFITYNKNSEIGENTALRMQTLQSLYGLKIFLPYRLHSKSISNETKIRIEKSRFILAFSIDKFTETLKEELEYALAKNKPVVVIYDEQQGKNIKFNKNKNVEEVYIDYYNTDEALHQISDFLRTKFSNAEKKQTENAIGIGLVAIGLGLLVNWALTDK
ncbi:MAG: hypothetical protein U9R42_04300 [Bacteroidota bacterium]|nr:hypothetical protein [Bacteroidota bacterium]